MNGLEQLKTMTTVVADWSSSPGKSVAEPGR